jgi:hypothetical protein
MIYSKSNYDRNFQLYNVIFLKKNCHYYEEKKTIFIFLKYQKYILLLLIFFSNYKKKTKIEYLLEKKV